MESLKQLAFALVLSVGVAMVGYMAFCLIVTLYN
jgi:hypothetical protein